MRVLLFILVVISSCACVAQADNSNSSMHKIDCAAISNSPQLDDCVKKQVMQSNAEVLSEIKSFEKRAMDLYVPDPKLGKELISKVHDAQNAWLNFREKNCSVEAFEIEKGTSAYTTTINNCIIRMNAERIKVLKELLK